MFRIFRRRRSIVSFIIAFILFLLINYLDRERIQQDNANMQKYNQEIKQEDRYQTALNKAEIWGSSSYGCKSKEAIFRALMVRSPFANYSREEAEYAVNNARINWKKNALFNAEQQYNLGFKSKKRVYNRLIYDFLFTKEEAEYGVNNAKVNWNP